MTETMIELDDDQVLEQLDDLARLDTASLTGRYSPPTVARVVRWMSLEMRMRSLPREDALPHDFAFKVASQVGLVGKIESGAGRERTLAAAGLTLMTGGGVGAMAWMSRLVDLADFAGLSGFQLGAASSLMMPLFIGIAALSFYAAMDKFLPGWLAKR